MRCKLIVWLAGRMTVVVNAKIGREVGVHVDSDIGTLVHNAVIDVEGCAMWIAPGARNVVLSEAHR